MVGGYKSHFDAVMCKFPFRERDGSLQIPDGSVGCVDGQTKIMTMFGITLLCKEKLSPSQLMDPTIQDTLASFRAIRCAYTHYDNPAHFFLHSLRHLSLNCHCAASMCIFLSLILCSFDFTKNSGMSLRRSNLRHLSPSSPTSPSPSRFTNGSPVSKFP